MQSIGVTSEPVQQWELLNPEGVIKLDPVEPAPRISTLAGKTVVLSWNGKDNGENYLNRVAELLAEHVPDARVIKLWEVDLSTAVISQSPTESEERAAKIAGLGADIVIGAVAD